jgi:3-isopropylmalate dehydratase small subunit
MPILSYDKGLIDELNIQDGDMITVNLETGAIQNQRSGKSGKVQPFSPVQMDIYKRGGLLNK